VVTEAERAWLRYSILAAQREGNRLLSAFLKALQVTPAQAEALTVIAEFEPLSVRRLGALLVCETGSPSRLASSLAAHGWIERQPDPEDSRRTQLRLTRAGRTLVDQIRRQEERFYAAVAERLEGLGAGDAWNDLAQRILRGSPSERALVQRKLWPGGQPRP